MLGAGAVVARAQDGDSCASADLRFGGATYYAAPEVGRGRPATGASLGEGRLAGRCGSVAVMRARRVNQRVGVLAGDPPRIYVATGFLEPLSAHPLHLWLHRRGEPRRPAACSGERMTATGAASREFRRDEELRVSGVRVIVHNRTRAVGLDVAGVPKIVRGQRIIAVGPGCGARSMAASSISAGG